MSLDRPVAPGSPLKPGRAPPGTRARHSRDSAWPRRASESGRGRNRKNAQRALSPPVLRVVYPVPVVPHPRRRCVAGVPDREEERPPPASPPRRCAEQTTPPASCVRAPSPARRNKRRHHRRPAIQTLGRLKTGVTSRTNLRCILPPATRPRSCSTFPEQIESRISRGTMHLNSIDSGANIRRICHEF